MKKILTTLLAAFMVVLGLSAENYILYTSSDGQVVTPNFPEFGGAKIISNTYENGQGKILFDGEVTTIGHSAFYACASLTSVEIPNSVTTIGVYAFAGCTGLTSVEIPNSVTTIGDWAFAGCTGLTSVEIPNSVTTIGEYAFYACTGLTSVEIPNSVTTIGYAAFAACTGLTSVEIPNSVTTIGMAAFAGCTGLTSFYGKFASEDHRCLIMEGVLSAFAPAGLILYVIPNSVTTIGENAFYACTGLTSVEIPNSVTTIGDHAFYGCTGLTSFYGKFASEDHRCLIMEGVLSAFAPAGLILYVIPNSVTTIGEAAFYGCTSLTSVEIPNSVTTIGRWAFEGCTGLTSVEIPNSVTTIGRAAFYECTNLTSFYGKFASEDHRCLIMEGVLNAFAPAGLILYVIPNSVTTIGGSAFAGCTGLTSVEIPNSVTTIGDWAFSGCI